MYKLNDGFITRLSDGASIPLSDGNSDYAEYLSWLEEGNTPLPSTAYVVHQDTPESAIGARLWRDAELSRADVILNRVQDGETGLGTQKAWRAYRVELRNWPETDNFPEVVPLAPDAK